MSLKIKLYRKMPFLQSLSGLKHLKKTISEIKEVKQAFKTFKKDIYISISDENLAVFKKAFLKFLWNPVHEKDIPILFTKCQIVPNKISNIKLDKYDPMLICVEKNDLKKLKVLFKHYREIGVKKFIIIDNESTDGTIEYLKKQKDVDLYICHTKYSTLNKEAWTNRILAHYGFDKWYLYVDSDELFIYENCENKKINEFIKELEENNQNRVPALMTEMYSKDNIFSKIDTENIIEEYCYYDYDTYFTKNEIFSNTIRGGVRERGFGLDPLLTKHPLFKLKKGDIQAWSHWQFPYKENYNLNNMGALLHYKFLSDDLKKYAEIDFSGSLEYKTYLDGYEKNKKINFYSEHSKKYTTSTEFFKSLKIK